MQRKLLGIFLSAMLVLGLTACAGNSGDNEERSTTMGNTGTTDSTTNAEDSTPGSTGKTLVVYYSATGNTEEVAQVIAEETGADLFEIVPKDIYTSEDLNWTNEDSRVSVEHENPEDRDVELTDVTVDNWEEYDVVYIGYPIWWAIAAWPVDTFVKANDFSGKTVIPFATASTSGIGQSGKLLEEMAGSGNWLDGECFRSSATDETILSWVKSHGI